MLNQLLRFTLFSSALLWLRPRWRGLLALTASVVLIHVLHSEYLGYVELSGNSDFLVWSYVCKWLALVVCVSLYVGLAVYGLKAPGKSAPQQVRSAADVSLDRAAKEPVSEPEMATDDGFDFLRSKQKLESRADKIIAKTR
ncbi:MAG: hypothetical protein AB8B48_19595 [Pseudomonadales bacterium]